VIHVVFRHRPGANSEAAFPAAWELLKAKMVAQTRGLESATLFRNAQDPSEFVWVTCWTSLEDWKAFWSEGVPDPEGDPARNDILVELKTLTAEDLKHTSRKRSPRRKGKRERAQGRDSDTDRPSMPEATLQRRRTADREQADRKPA
jgi:heme-degrading monooxygenase HmoA